MSGKFERIAHRQADRPDEDGDQAIADATATDQPTERMEAVTPPPSDAAGDLPATPPPTTPPPPTIDLTTRIPAVEATGAQPAAAAQPDPAPQAPAAPADATAATVVAEPAPRRPGFRARGRMRRRLRYLRKLRELQVRDLGGLVFDLRRFERKRDDLVAQKIDQIRACDDELHALEQALEERRDLRDVREPGIGGTCPRCFAIYGSADKFCANCGAAFGGAVQGPAAQVPLAPPTPPAPSPPPSTPAADRPDGPGSRA
jgi:hypothetical protein